MSAQRRTTLAKPSAPGELDPHWLSDYVGRTAAWLQGSLLDESRRDHSEAQATLARLRHAVGKLERSQEGQIAASSVAPEVFEVTIGGFPEAAKPHGDFMSHDEIASFLALTLFAVHQQSQLIPMHRLGRTFGAALGELRRQVGENREKGVVRAFNALLTATGIDEISYHSRRIIGQLRQAGIAFDYGRFAEDLRDIQNDYRIDSVRLRWGRDFYRRPAEGDESTSDK